MRRPLRHALAVLRAAGLEVDRIYQAGKHTEVHFIDANGGGLVRIHRGNRLSVAFERNLRTVIRKHLRAGTALTREADGQPSTIIGAVADKLMREKKPTP